MPLHVHLCLQVWDPTLIIAQILSMQFLFYLCMGLVQMVALSECGQQRTAAAAHSNTSQHKEQQRHTQQHRQQDKSNGNRNHSTWCQRQW